ncbi:adenosylhomocysteine nucleosidase [Evansella vedderi]|uniref:adenosylhomocysteine nucleosidase n=1 Tax=Evansella vedderi TaxID=38282 RepID=A0ABT9ZUT3_9BACI|nr:5'-methylthioadenosine/adenosylhomocysteine nucleosidase [Evansella vedderi]MDQ0255003.1 adenosylhomocysteine nucleosidase [Evansella vedderi]
MKYGIIGAMKEEVVFFKDSVEDINEIKKGLLTFFTGYWYGHEVVICQSGVGKVNAAMCAQIIIDLFDVDKIIFTGVAGGVEEELNVEDVVISTECQEHDIDASPLGFNRGIIPMHEGTSVFPADEELVEKAYKGASFVLEGASKVIKGKIISGDKFIADKMEVTALQGLFQPACVEMEGAAVAHVCHFNGVPFVVIRSISDKANGEAPASFDSFVEKVAITSSKIVEQILKG